MRSRRALVSLFAATLLLTSCASNSEDSIGVSPPAEQPAVDGGIEETATPTPVVSDATANSLTDEQLNEIISLCFNEVLADPEITNVIAAMPEEWAQSTYDMAQNQYCETVVVNVEEWRKMSRFDD